MDSNLNYTQWRTEHKRILESFNKKNVILLFSAGKDSSVLMDLMVKAKEEFGFDFTPHTGTFPVHRYPDQEIKRIDSYWVKRGVRIIWHDMGETDVDLKNSKNPCLPCQERRRQLLKNILARSIKDWHSLVLIVSYSLWDLVSYSLEYVLNNISYNSDQREGVEKNKRFKETAQRFYPLLMMKEGYQIFRPLIKYNNNAILKAIAQENLPTLSIPCKYKEFRPKRILEQYYEKMGLRFDYNQLIEFTTKSLDLPSVSSYTAMEKEDYLGKVF
jgi:tRNA(Ile)-lysidine synthase TilS/MesJ